MHMVHSKNLHMSDENLVTEFVFTSYINSIISPDSVTLRHRHHALNNRDFNFKDREKGLQPTQFEFIGPDREVVAIKNVDHYLDSARVVLNTCQSNYK